MVRISTEKMVQADFLMLITAAIWGTAFVAQRAGMAHVGPFTFNAVRFALGGLSLFPFLLSRGPLRDGGSPPPKPEPRKFVYRAPLARRAATVSRFVRDRIGITLAGIIAGVLLFLGSSFQQVGIVYTTAGNAGFITGLYVILVPLIGLIFGQRPGPLVWAGALLAMAGLYFINDAPGFSLGRGDLLVLFCALFFAVHVLLIGRYSPVYPTVPLSIIQFLTCSVLSFAAALLTEEIAFERIIAAAVPILYGGVGSVGIAYTLQVIGQKHAPPTHAAIILSLESVFALVGGMLLLGEEVPLLKALGCALMLAGMLAAQMQRFLGSRPPSPQ